MNFPRSALRVSVFALALGLALLPISLRAAGDDPIVGKWSGQVTEKSGTDSTQYPLSIQFDSPTHGTTDYPSNQCSGDLTGGPSGDKAYAYTEKMKTGDCADGGHLEVKVVNQTTISILWSSEPGDKGYTVSGTLTRE